MRRESASTAIPSTQVGKLHAVDNTAPLDTLWHTLKVTALDPTYGRLSPSLAATEKPYSIYPVEEQMVTVNEGYATYATLSLIRDTKHLNLTLFQTDNPSEMDADDYEVGIVDDKVDVSIHSLYKISKYRSSTTGEPPRPVFTAEDGTRSISTSPS